MNTKFTVLALSLWLLTSLLLMSQATQGSEQFGRLYTPLLLLNTAGLAVLLGMIGTQIHRLMRQWRERQPGSRLTLRMLTLFVALAVTPMLVVYAFSVHFLMRGIDSWYDVRIEKAVKDSLELSRAALDLRMRELLRDTELIADELTDSSDAVAPLDLNALKGQGSTMVLNAAETRVIDLGQLRLRSGAEELSLMTPKGQIITTSSPEAEILPNTPSDSVLLQVSHGRSYIGLDPIRDGGLNVRVVVNVPALVVGAQGQILQALYPISTRMNELADSVQSIYAKYSSLEYLRKQLKLSFVMTLTLVLALSILSTVWAAIYSAGRIAAPIRDLAEGTRAIARGHYDKQLPVLSRDEMGFLVESFNKMARRIGIAQDQIRKSRDRAAAERAYLEAVLSRLSSGVLTFDSTLNLHTFNPSGAKILGVPLELLLGEPLEAIISAEHSALRSFFAALVPKIRSRQSDWTEEITLFGSSGRQVLMCRGTTLSDSPGILSGHVIVFDDITAIVQGQRDAAWSEVARRLAHEIKNPLTPIQLSAERLRHKYLKHMAHTEGDALDRLTNTIIQQVKIIKEMVNTFSEYARSPTIKIEPVELNKVVEEVLDLYRNANSEAILQTQLDPELPLIEADQGRMRQVLNNLVKNALEAKNNGHNPWIKVVTSSKAVLGHAYVELRVEDRGTGISEEILPNLFQPYVTTKPKGTGLGLAIVKKIVEEHNGIVWMENNQGTGATAIIRLPVVSRALAALPAIRNAV